MSQKVRGAKGVPGHRGENTPEVRAKFLELLAERGVFLRCAYAVGLCPQTLREHMKKDPEFGKQVELARERFTEALEAEAIDRAMKGWLEPVVSMGAVVAQKRVKSEGLLQTLLRANSPKYRNNGMTDINATGAVFVMPAPMTQEAWQEVAARMQRPAGAVVEKQTGEK